MNGEALEQLWLAAGDAWRRGDYEAADELAFAALQAEKARPNHSVWTRDEERAERDR